MLKRLIYGRMMSVMNTFPEHVKRELGLDREEMHARAHEAAYGHRPG